MAERERFIYDSSTDNPPCSPDNFLEVACTSCQTFCSVNHTKDANGMERDFEYLALFLGEHLGHSHALKACADSQNTAWQAAKAANNWQEYEY